MKKRRHHYVWQHYLRAWTVDDQLWCARAGAVFRSATVNVANSRDFYRLQELTPQDVHFIEAGFLAKSHPMLRDLARGWIQMFQLSFAAKRLYEASGARTAEGDSAFDVAINDMEENLHSAIEGDAIPLIDALRTGDLNFWSNDEDCRRVLFFLCVQYHRTANIRRSIIAAASPIPNFNLDAAIGVLRLIFATNVGASLFFGRESTRVTLLRAPPTVEFITADQPVINTKAVGLERGQQVEELEFYYPVSPTCALIVTPDAVEPGVVVLDATESDVGLYNGCIVQMADEQVYASSRVALDAALSTSAT